MTMTDTLVVAGRQPYEGRQRGVIIVPMASRRAVGQPEDRHRGFAPDLPFMLEHDIVDVLNIDDVVWEFPWDRKRWRIAPGDHGYVPFPAAVLKLGDPRTREDEHTRFRTPDGRSGCLLPRYDELCRLCAMYGVEREDFSELVEIAPKVEAKTMEGHSILWPTQNPWMSPYPVHNTPEPGRENADTRVVIDQLRSQNQQLQNQYNELRSMIDEKLGVAPPATAPQGDLTGALLGASPDTGPTSALG
jgi:hypothetical protein